MHPRNERPPANSHESVAAGASRAEPAPRESERFATLLAELGEAVAVAELAALRIEAERLRALAEERGRALERAGRRVHDHSSANSAPVDARIIDVARGATSEEALWYERVVRTYDYKQQRRRWLDSRRRAPADVIDVP